MLPNRAYLLLPNCGKYQAMVTLLIQVNERTVRFPLAENVKQVTAGSLPEHGIYLPYRGVSRNHFSIVQKKEGWVIRDEGSTNGTLLNGQKILESILEPGDEIQIGFIRIQVLASTPETEPFLFPDLPEEKNDARTDELDGTVPEEKELFSFPKLIRPEGYLFGRSPVMIQLYQKLQSVVDSDVNILLIGETGTGKEMIARMIHRSGKRFSGPFIAVNCAAIPADLLEAELFGIGERVATDVSQRKGKFAAADGGILFLDELETFPYALQAKVLRALEEKAVTPVGENRMLSVNFRLIAATNQEPQELIATQRLREDLYHRLSTVELRLPPLRERKDDLPLLIPQILKRFAASEDKHFAGISKRLMALLLDYSYPGNLRELNNILRAIITLAHPGEILDFHLLPERLLTQKNIPALSEILQNKFRDGRFDIHQALDDVSREFVLQSLKLHDGNLRKASEHLGMTEFGLRKMIKRLGIQIKK